MKISTAILLGVLLSPSTSRAEPIKIGILTDLSGGMASWGKQAVIGAEIARDEVNQANGDLKLIFSDHQLQAKSAVSEFQKLTEVDKVDAVYTEFTPSAVAVAPLSKAKKIPVIYSAAATSPVKASPYIFKSYIDYIHGCRLVGEHWRENGITTIGILRATLEFGDLCATGIKQVYPSAIEVGYNPGDEVATQVLLLRSKGVQAIINPGFEPDLLRMLKSLKDLNWSPLIATQSDAVADETIARFPKLLSNITIFALPPLPDQFISRVKAKDPSNNLVSISAAGLSYLHVKQLYAARLKCPARGAECMVDELSHAPPDDVIGFTKWSERIAVWKVRLLTWRDGKEVEQPLKSQM